MLYISEEFIKIKSKQIYVYYLGINLNKMLRCSQIFNVLLLSLIVITIETSLRKVKKIKAPIPRGEISTSSNTGGPKGANVDLQAPIPRGEISSSSNTGGPKGANVD